MASHLTNGSLAFPWPVQHQHFRIASVPSEILGNFARYLGDSYTVMAMAISYNWLFQWDEIHSINGVSSVLITGIWGLNCRR